MLDLLPLAQAAPAPGGLLGSPFVLIAVLFGVMYFTMIRPQAKQAKAHRAMIAALKKGDRIVTQGGIHGKVTQVDETSILAEVDGSTKLRFDKHKVAYVVGDEKAAA
jgi:preprotein translocase subunit YajC